MRVVGITGGIGSGKSEILKFLEASGAYVVEADKLAHTLMEPGCDAYNRIVDYFGNNVLCKDGRIDREVLGRAVFSDKEAIKKLNSIVHPAVKEYIIDDIARKRIAASIDLYVIEAALLIQDGYRLICDEIWYIYVDRDERIKRLVKGRGGDEAKYESVIDSQAADDYYRENCDVIIDNNGSFKKTETLLKELLNKSMYCDTMIH